MNRDFIFPLYTVQALSSYPLHTDYHFLGGPKGCFDLLRFSLLSFDQGLQSKTRVHE